jgi:4-amino-4-deoxy-L-arabinose transferase-like glycosyltransferase
MDTLHRHMVLSHNQELIASSFIYLILVWIMLTLQIIDYVNNNSNLRAVSQMFISGMIVSLGYWAYFLYRNYERDIQPLANDERV